MSVSGLVCTSDCDSLPVSEVTASFEIRMHAFYCLSCSHLSATAGPARARIPASRRGHGRGRAAACGPPPPAPVLRPPVRVRASSQGPASALYRSRTRSIRILRLRYYLSVPPPPAEPEAARARALRRAASASPVTRAGRRRISKYQDSSTGCLRSTILWTRGVGLRL